MILALLLLFQLQVPDAAQFVGEPKGVPLSGAALTQRTHEVGSLLRCPVCQGMSISDSPSEMAINMRGQVHELLARGYTEEQILKYFELSYGQFVLLKPKTPVVWILPVIALLIGVVVVFLKLRNLRTPPLRSGGAAPDDPYVSRVRELVDGGKQS